MIFFEFLLYYAKKINIFCHPNPPPRQFFACISCKSLFIRAQALTAPLLAYTSSLTRADIFRWNIKIFCVQNTTCSIFDAIFVISHGENVDWSQTWALLNTSVGVQIRIFWKMWQNNERLRFAIYINYYYFNTQSISLFGS